MAFVDIIATAFAIGIGLLVNYWSGNIKYWNVVIVIGVYLLFNLIFHLLIRYQCRPYISGSNPKHLVVIVTGYLGHYIRIIGLQESFKRYHNPLNEDVMVILSRNVNTGFFFWTFWKSCDGIHKGGMRLCNEVKGILDANPSIDKISFIGCSLGGLWTRYCLKFLVDSEDIHTINGRSVQFINYISLASPHCGARDWVTQAPLCCCCPCINLFWFTRWMKKFHLLPLTVQQLLLLDDHHLLAYMASSSEYLTPLGLFKNRVCFGNAKHDQMVSCSSALMLHGNQCQIGDVLWKNRMDKERHVHWIEELTINQEYCPSYPDVALVVDGNDERREVMCWFEALRSEMEWKRVIVCWNQNDCARKRSHDLLAAPLLCYSGCQTLYHTIFENFQYNDNWTIECFTESLHVALFS
eukprot:1052807_1